MVILRFYKNVNEKTYMIIGTTQFKIDYVDNKILYADCFGGYNVKDFKEVRMTLIDLPTQFIDVIEG